MELINRIRKSRKGFTLVEIIVVLVILAILAAFTIPTMLGFVNDAKDKAYLAEAREIYVAAQASATEEVASSKAAVVAATLGTALSGSSNGTNTTVTNVGMKKMLGNDISNGASWVTTATAVGGAGADKDNATGKIGKIVYTIPNTTPARTITIENGEATFSN